MAQNLGNKCVFIVWKYEVCGFNDNPGIWHFSLGGGGFHPCTFCGFLEAASDRVNHFKV